jgi:hypothetical protein
VEEIEFFRPWDDRVYGVVKEGLYTLPKKLFE